MKIGLFFGSFNPIHIGHLVLANYMLEFTELERIWFVISPHNPLKEKKTLLKDNHRLQMVRLAIGDHTKMKASNIEFDLPQPSAHEFALIMGSDNLGSFHKWKNYEYILQHHKIFVYPRPGMDGGILKTHSSVHFTDAPLLEISSSFLREAIKNKKDVRFYFPPDVWTYLKEMHFYEK